MAAYDKYFQPGQVLALASLCLGCMAVETGPSPSTIEGREIHKCDLSQITGMPNNVGELFSQNQYIGVFRPKNKLRGLKQTNRIQVNYIETELFQMQLEERIQGSPPSTIIVETLPPPDRNAFIEGATDRHRQMVNEDRMFLGSSLYAQKQNGQCDFLPSVIEEGSYLVIGGVVSPAAFEAIFLKEEDDLYRAAKTYTRSPG